MSGFFNQILTDDGFEEGSGNFISGNSVKHGLQPIFARPKVPIEEKRKGGFIYSRLDLKCFFSLILES